MTPEAVLDLLQGVILACARAGGPVLVVALAVGLIVGVLQAATQINEASISFVVKLIAVSATVIALGPWTLRTMTEYTRRTIAASAEVR